MKKTMKILSMLAIILITTGCFYNNVDQKIKEKDNKEKETMTMNVIIDNKKYIAEVENNETAQMFIKKLPQSFIMTELNGNEKYFYMEDSLPIDSSNPKQIVAGDIMLYGKDCLVIFYKSFVTNYSYTKIGHIDNLPDLGNKNISVTFEK